jgi:hypothetical protein
MECLDPFPFEKGPGPLVAEAYDHLSPLLFTLYVQHNNVKSLSFERLVRQPSQNLFHRTVGKLLKDVPGQISGLSEGLVTQVCIPLGHGRSFVSQELLQSIKVHLAGGGQHRGIDMAQAMEGPEVTGDACRFFDLVYLVIDVNRRASFIKSAIWGLGAFSNKDLPSSAEMGYSANNLK